LATIDRNAIAYTMALTCPGIWSPEENNKAKAVFLMMLKRMTSSREKMIRDLGVYWKQELQSRSAVHFHLCIWGVDPQKINAIHTWLAFQWTDLVCRNRSKAESLSCLAVQLHKKNFEEVRNMAGYFSKYIGKEAEAVLVGDPIAGRWWGCINKDKIPFSRRLSIPSPPARFRVICHRVARKLRQKKANAAKHAAICRKAGKVWDSGPNKGDPIYSEFELACGKRRKIIRDEVLEFFNLRFAPYSFPNPIKMGKITLVSEFTSTTAKRLLEWAGTEYRAYLDVTPF